MVGDDNIGNPINYNTSQPFNPEYSVAQGYTSISAEAADSGAGFNGDINVLDIVEMINIIIQN